MNNTMYKAVFFNQGSVYELFCTSVESSHLWGFVEMSGLVFEPESTLVVDPTEEKMREEFAQTEQLMLPIQSIIRVEKVKRKGQCVIRKRNAGETVTPFPAQGPTAKK
ncbi:MAG: DUF1820 family protein [Pseudomonadota bacterium]